MSFLDFTAGVRLLDTFQQGQVAGIIQDLTAKKAAPIPTATASRTWGKPSNFSLAESGLIVGVTFPDNSNTPTDPNAQEPPPAQWYEECWAWHEMKIVNPDDDEQYIMVKVTRWSIFRLPDNSRVQLNFNFNIRGIK